MGNKKLSYKIPYMNFLNKMVQINKQNILKKYIYNKKINLLIKINLFKIKKICSKIN